MFGIYSNSFNIIQNILSNHSSIDEVKIYGSRAKGNYREGSDIDLVIMNKIDQKELASILDEFEESIIPYLIDLSIYSNLNSNELKNHINRVGQTFYKRNTENTSA